MQGQRLLVSIAAYENVGVNADRLSLVLQELDAARRDGVDVTLRLDLTRTPAENLKFPPGLKVSYTIHNKSVGYHLTGKYRTYFQEALKAGAYDWYLYGEDDLPLSADNLDALCEETLRLKDTEFMPGVLRYENAEVDRRNVSYLTDAGLCCPPQIERVLPVKHRKYIQPGNPYQAMWFLSAERFKWAVDNFGQRKRVAWGSAPAPKLIREFFAGMWLKPYFTKLVPLDTYERHLVHHTSDAYMADPERARRAGFLPTVEDYIEAAKQYRGSPIALPKRKR